MSVCRPHPEKLLTEPFDTDTAYRRAYPDPDTTRIAPTLFILFHFYPDTDWPDTDTDTET